MLPCLRALSLSYNFQTKRLRQPAALGDTARCPAGWVTLGRGPTASCSDRSLRVHPCSATSRQPTGAETSATSQLQRRGILGHRPQEPRLLQHLFRSALRNAALLPRPISPAMNCTYEEARVQEDNQLSETLQCCDGQALPLHFAPCRSKQLAQVLLDVTERRTGENAAAGGAGGRSGRRSAAAGSCRRAPRASGRDLAALSGAPRGPAGSGAAQSPAASGDLG